MLALFFMTMLAFSNEESEDFTYTEVKKEETVPFDGYLFTDDALTELILSHRGEIMTMEQQHLIDLEEQKLDFDYKFNLEQTKCDSKEEMYEELIEIRDNQIKLNQRKDFIQRFAFAGGFVLGSAVVIGVTYSVNQN